MSADTPIPQTTREQQLEAALRDLIKYTQDFRYWVEHNPDCAADPCAEDYNLTCSLNAAKELVPDAK